MTPTPVRTAGASAGLDADVFAAGAVCWRERGGALEVLLVHRPRYRDWSWPKGKIEAGETLPECAVREVAEETGLQITLGRPLPSARYPVGKKLTKHVSYWAAEVRGEQAPQPENPREIDEARWMSVREAYRKLSRYDDRRQLDALTEAHAHDGLRTVPLIIVRHGKAFPRSKWHETESLRPLLALGTRQALALTGLLAAWRPVKLISSPWKRCVATLKPYSAAHGLTIKLKPEISEKANKKKPERAERLIGKLIQAGRPVAVCTHRPVLPSILRAIESASPPHVAKRLPRKDPYLAPGEILVAHVRLSPTPRVAAVERFRPIDS
ncbi:NUDIX hydrolase [Sediminivirga luteola]|uniref:ADP-ribose pyrophosphatase n=1 Tax=Sediminivirga luteola TaxID=1774748 RepID=A0A8J2TXR9_9MICO|nr:NUDIX hydrolase [Sediminivirga luteola]MCI2267200.1 NUDIX hydrolase [Sediminivirga luteola]GGA13860.1 ADP-ribose pyrophosphatase [Sediminivirga luteola]